VKEFFSNGKLLISGEYVVLDGAVSLAVPTRYGQSLTVEAIAGQKIIWKSLDEKGHVWFKNEFVCHEDKVLSAGANDDISKRLLDILNTAKTLNPNFLKNGQGLSVITKLDFPRNWGLGTSSTLVNNIANWAQVDAYVLLEHTFGGSGYDIACAQSGTAITYRLNENKPEIAEVDFNLTFKDHLYFVHLNKKQNSREGIKHYREHKEDLAAVITEINAITQKMMVCDTLEAFMGLIERHERIIAKVTQQIPVQKALFGDFKGAIKSLGAWGGDFVLVASNEDPEAYFKAKGFDTVIPYKDMLL